MRLTRSSRLVVRKAVTAQLGKRINEPGEFVKNFV
jgi:hypothetical protein